MAGRDSETFREEPGLGGQNGCDPARVSLPWSLCFSACWSHSLLLHADLPSCREQVPAAQELAAAVESQPVSPSVSASTPGPSHRTFPFKPERAYWADRISYHSPPLLPVLIHQVSEKPGPRLRSRETELTLSPAMLLAHSHITHCIHLMLTEALCPDDLHRDIEEVNELWKLPR